MISLADQAVFPLDHVGRFSRDIQMVDSDQVILHVYAGARLEVEPIRTRTA